MWKLHTQQRSIYSDNIAATDDSIRKAEGGSWTTILISSCSRTRKGVHEPMFLTHYHLLKPEKREKIVVTIGGSQPLSGFTVQTSRRIKYCLPWTQTRNTDWTFVVLLFGTQKSFFHSNSCRNTGPENWDISFTLSGKKRGGRLVKSSDWSFSSNMRG